MLAPPRLEAQALACLRKRFPDLQRTGFSKAIRGQAPDEFHGRIGIIPDGWFYKPGPQPSMPGCIGTFVCVEIEDKHPLTPHKLRDYCELYASLDGLDYELHLFVFDRYGLNERQLDLCDLYLNGLVLRATEKRSGEQAWGPK